MSIDAAYFAKALWGDGRQPSSDRVARAKKLAGEFGVKWEDVAKLAPVKEADHAS